MDEKEMTSVGLTDILIDTLNKKYNNISDLNSLMVNLSDVGREELIPVIESILDSENENIGKLQKLIDMFSDSEDSIEKGKQDTLEIIDGNNEFLESYTSMEKLVLSENFDNVIDDVQAVADPVFVGANEEHDENKKKYEDAMEENKKAAEETIPKEGDEGKEVKSSDLKKMHLSESLFEELSDYDFDDFNHKIYNAIADVFYEYRNRAISREDLERALEFFDIHFWDSDDFEDEDYVEIDESLNKDVVKSCGENIAEYILTEFVDLDLKNSEIREVIRWVMNHFSGPDFEESLKESYDRHHYDFEERFHPDGNLDDGYVAKTQEEFDDWTYWLDENDIDYDYEKSLEPDSFAKLRVRISRYSDVIPPEKRKYWYFTTHGVQPGSIPKDLKVLETRDGQNDKGTWGTYVCLNGVLNTGELKKYDMIEKAPLVESLQVEIAKEQLKRFKEGKMSKNFDSNVFIESLEKKNLITKKDSKKLKEWYRNL